jgi:hypothetical protein
MDLKLLHKNLQKTLDDMGIANYFINKIPIVQEVRVRIDK